MVQHLDCSESVTRNCSIKKPEYLEIFKLNSHMVFWVTAVTELEGSLTYLQMTPNRGIPLTSIRHINKHLTSERPTLIVSFHLQFN
jgi:hypothetical protein